MNQRIAKLKEERAKTANRIETLQARLKALDEQILRLENTEIVGIVRDNGLSIDKLAELMDLLDERPTAVIPAAIYETEEKTEDEE